MGAIDGGNPAEKRWAEALAAWAIPDDILRHAPESPWSFPPAVFRAAARRPDPDSASLRVAREALGAGGTVLDVGCGGGAAGLALAPPATHVTGVDSSAELLAVFDADAGEAGVAHDVVHGSWPDVATGTPAGDVVVCHHVVYNVARVVPFVTALAVHARRRVVIELTARHPLCATAPLWRRFWGIDRPDGPTAEDLVAVLGSMGVDPSLERRRRPSRRERADAAHAAMVRRQLCLPPEREAEVVAALAELDESGAPGADVEVVTLWWDA